MKIVKTASGKQTIKISKKEWTSLGKKAGWIKTATSSREKVMHDLRSILGDKAFIRPTEEFDGTPDGIWFSNEEDGIDGLPTFDTNGETEMLANFGIEAYPYQAHPKLEALMNSHNWYIEPYDGGTLMAWTR